MSAKGTQFSTEIKKYHNMVDSCIAYLKESYGYGPEYSFREKPYYTYSQKEHDTKEQPCFLAIIPYLE